MARAQKSAQKSAQQAGLKSTPRSGQTSRRRFARRQWARRWLTWRYLVSLVVVLAVIIGGIYTVYFSSVLATERVEVTGVDRLGNEQILAAADVPVGEPLALLDTDQIAYRLRSLADIKEVDVSREWPNTVLIKITERTPIAVVEIGTQLRSLDEDGAVFGDYKRAPGNLPRVRTGADTDADALREAAQVVAGLPEETAILVDYVEVITVDQISLELKDGREVVWGSAEQSQEKGEVLAALLAQRKAKVYDVSVPGNPTTQG